MSIHQVAPGMSTTRKTRLSVVLLPLLLAITTVGVTQENPGRSALRPGNQDSAVLAKGQLAGKESPCQAAQN